MKKFQGIRILLILSVLGIGGYFGYHFYTMTSRENAVLKQVIQRLEAETRVAEVLVTGVNFVEREQKTYTTIKFLEYDAEGRPLEPRYFSFSGNIIQFQSLVMRFDDLLVRRGDRLRGKSAFIFWKVFMLDGEDTTEYELTKAHSVPDSYKIGGDSLYESKLWQQFWTYALDPVQAKKDGIKNAQIEAPGTAFVPGIVYTIKIEHDGGLRIDATPLPSIIRGELIP